MVTLNFGSCGLTLSPKNHEGSAKDDQKKKTPSPSPFLDAIMSMTWDDVKKFKKPSSEESETA